MSNTLKILVYCLGVLAVSQVKLVGGAELSVASPPASNATAQQLEPPKSDDNYIIGAGDSLQIFVWLYPELTMTLSVRPDGKITSPLVENMLAADKTPSKLARDIEVVLDEKGVKNPQVAVIVMQAISVNSKVQVTGAVRQPLSMPYYKGLKVLDLIEKAGLSEFASPNKAHISREVNGKAVNIKVRLGDLINKGDMTQNLELQPGDVLFVRQSLF
jgi:polysaccharide export outer membrane protein